MPIFLNVIRHSLTIVLNATHKTETSAIEVILSNQPISTTYIIYSAQRVIDYIDRLIAVTLSTVIYSNMNRKDCVVHTLIAECKQINGHK